MSLDDKILIWAAIICVAIVLAVPQIMGATYTHEQTWRDPDGIYDSLRYYIKVGNAIRDSSSVALADSTTTTATLDQDSTYTEEVYVFGTGSTFWSSPSTTILPRWTGGTATTDLSGDGAMVVRVLGISGSDTLSGVRFTAKNSSGATEGYLTSGASGAVTFGLDTGTWTFVAEKNGYFDVVTDSAVTASDTFLITLSADGSIATPATAVQATLYGYLIDGSGTALEGATVKCRISPKQTNLVDTTSSKNIVFSRLVKGPSVTDSTGLFSFTVIRSTAYSGADTVFYYLDAAYFGEKIFEGLKVYVPDTGNVNLGDTLAARL